MTRLAWCHVIRPRLLVVCVRCIASSSACSADCIPTNDSSPASAPPLDGASSRFELEHLRVLSASAVVRVGRRPAPNAGAGGASGVSVAHVGRGLLASLRCRAAFTLGLALVHFSAQLEPCLSQENKLHTLNTPLTRATQPLRAPPIPYKALKLS